jgi:hypothetical protein
MCSPDHQVGVTANKNNEARRADMIMPILRTSRSFLTADHDLTVAAYFIAALWASQLIPILSPSSRDQKKSEYSSRFGEPVPAFVITFVVALLTIALRIVVDEADGFACL